MKELIYAAFALVSLAGGPPAMKDVEEEQEREISLEEVPETARFVILREAAEHLILEVDEVVIGEEIYYEAEWTDEGREVEIRVRPDGTIAGREIEDSDDEDDADDAEEKEAD